MGIDVIGAVSLEDGANCVEQLLLFCGDADVCRKRKVSVTRGDSSVPTVKGIERARAVIRTKDGQLKPSKMTHQAASRLQAARKGTMMVFDGGGHYLYAVVGRIFSPKLLSALIPTYLP